MGVGGRGSGGGGGGGGGGWGGRVRKKYSFTAGLTEFSRRKMTKSGIDLVIFRRFSATLPCVSNHSTFDYSASRGLMVIQKEINARVHIN